LQLKCATFFLNRDTKWVLKQCPAVLLDICHALFIINKFIFYSTRQQCWTFFIKKIKQLWVFISLWQVVGR
jgi:hypothetical protein